MTASPEILRNGRSGCYTVYTKSRGTLAIPEPPQRWGGSWECLLPRYKSVRRISDNQSSGMMTEMMMEMKRKLGREEKREGKIKDGMLCN